MLVGFLVGNMVYLGMLQCGVFVTATSLVAYQLSRESAKQVMKTCAVSSVVTPSVGFVLTKAKDVVLA